MDYILKNLSLIIIFIFIGCKSDSDVKQNHIPEKIIIDDYTVKIDSLIQTTNPRIFNGVILISKNGEVKYSKNIGYSNIEIKKQINLSDNFRIQSNSKQITAVLILKELEKGSIELHKPIKEFLPELEQPWVEDVTIHHLLNMSSGITDLNKKLIYEPGKGYNYSNPAYGLLGRIIENVTDKEYVDVANNLFKELSMDNTFCYEFGKEHKNLVSGYLNNKNKLSLVDFYSRGITSTSWRDFIPAGGIISNVVDLNIWDSKLHNGEILNEKTYDLMTGYSITGQHAAFGDEKIGYGYGVRIDEGKSSKIIGHAGKGIGFANIKFHVPEHNLNVIVLENIYDEDPNIVYHFERKILGLVMNSNLVK